MGPRKGRSGKPPASVKGGEQRVGRDLRQSAFAFHASLFVIGLEVEPELRAVAEVLREAECGVRGDGALAMHDLIDAARWHADDRWQGFDFTEGRSLNGEELSAEWRARGVQVITAFARGRSRPC